MTDPGNQPVEKEACDRVARILHGLISDGDERTELSISSTVVMSSPELSAYKPKGEYPTSDGRVSDVDGPFELWDAVDNLRAACYRKRPGTWFSARISVKNASSATAKYNYDEEPDFGLGGIDPSAYVVNPENFPRDEEHQAEWLKKRLAGAEQGFQGRVDVSS